MTRKIAPVIAIALAIVTVFGLAQVADATHAWSHPFGARGSMFERQP